MSKLKIRGKIHGRINEFNFLVDPPLPPRRAMRYFCLGCCCGNSAEVRRCQISSCTLWPFRMGRGICTDPAGEVVSKKELSPAQLEAARRAGKRLAAARQN